MGRLYLPCGGAARRRRRSDGRRASEACLIGSCGPVLWHRSCLAVRPGGSSVQQWRPCACGAVLAGGRRAPEPPPWGPAGPHWGGGDSGSGEQRVPLGGLYATASWDTSALWCAFMFASKRCKLVKRLWEESAKLVVSYYASSQPPLCAAAVASPTVSYEAFCSLEDRKAVESMLKHLCVSQLQTMLQAVQTKGRDGCECLLLPHHDVKLPHEVVAPHVLCCRLWRWPQLRHHYELRRLPWCAAASPPVVCCNPYHWSIVQKPGKMSISLLPPPPGCRLCGWQLLRFPPYLLRLIGAGAGSIFIFSRSTGSGESGP